MIRNKDRNAVRIIELPACKMVWSGVCADGSNTGESEQLRRFNAWGSKQDKLRQDRFYARDFMWWDFETNGPAWGFAVTEIPKDTGGYAVIDFPGGLYAAVNYVSDMTEDAASTKNAVSAYESIKKWVKKSGCFAMDESEGRRIMWQFINPQAAATAMGYSQQDMYVPIRIKGAGEK